MRRLLFTLALRSGCAAIPPETAEPPLGPGEVRSAVAFERNFIVGETRKSDVRAAPATAVDFPSGYEVWVYRQPAREKPPSPGAELVLLFDPRGVLAKTRVAPTP